MTARLEPRKAKRKLGQLDPIQDGSHKAWRRSRLGLPRASAYSAQARMELWTVLKKPAMVPEVDLPAYTGAMSLVSLCGALVLNPGGGAAAVRQWSRVLRDPRDIPALPPWSYSFEPVHFKV
jgi:hypothetical protein